MSLHSLLRPLLDALYPPVCLLCGQESEGPHPHCCLECFGAFEPVAACCPGCGLPYHAGQSPHLCLPCLTTRRPYVWGRSLYVYREPLAGVIRKLKYSRSTPMLNPLVEAFLVGVERIELPDQDAVVPVPMGFWRNVRRGFNQAQVLAMPLARRLGLPIEGKALRRTGRPQVGLGRNERRRNAMAAFAAGSKIAALEGKRVLLVDDVYTTGSTVLACARILRSAGAEVSVLTLARTVESGLGSRPADSAIAESGPQSTRSAAKEDKT